MSIVLLPEITWQIQGGVYLRFAILGVPSRKSYRGPSFHEAALIPDLLHRWNSGHCIQRASSS